MKSFVEKLRECISKSTSIDTVILAKAINVSQSSVSQWQLGQKTPSKNNMKKLANFFNVPIEYFLDDELEIIPKNK
jgi:transcriptional regulator with XRE-family HTH domain